MINMIIQLSVLSGGLLPLMALLLLITLAVIIERLYFFGKVLTAGRAMEHDVHLVKYQSLADLQAVAKHYEGTLQGSIVQTALASRGEDAVTMDRHIDEAILWQLPKLDQYLWVLDTSVTLAPLMGLFGTIIGMIQTFDILGKTAAGTPDAVTGGIGQALVATGAGLLIAIVAIIFLNYFNKRLRLATHQMELLKIMVTNRLYGGGSEHHGQPQDRASSATQNTSAAVDALARVR
jgi:biopolymer transport protein ExbB